jgi:hypothetical protein
MGDYSHLKNKKGELIARPLPQPTLPNLSVDDDDSSSMKTRVPASSTYTQDSYYYKGDKGLFEYPPMPPYSPYNTYANPSSAMFSHDDSAYPPPHKYDDDNESTMNLAAAAAPNPYDASQNGTGSAPPQLHQRSPPSSMGQLQGGMGYVPEYPGQYPTGMFAAPYASSPAPMSNQLWRQQSRGRDEENGYGSQLAL